MNKNELIERCNYTLNRINDYISPNEIKIIEMKLDLILCEEQRKNRNVKFPRYDSCKADNVLYLKCFFKKWHKKEVLNNMYDLLVERLNILQNKHIDELSSMN